jgi:protein involved in polysaccharide export with SLBB domain
MTTLTRGTDSFGAVSISVSTLVQGVFGAMSMTRLTTAGSAVFLVGALTCVGVGMGSGKGVFAGDPLPRTLRATSGGQDPNARRDNRTDTPPDNRATAVGASISVAQRRTAPPWSRDSYVVEAPDILLVDVDEALPDRPIHGERLVRPDGTIALGLYGDVSVAGLTVREVKEKVVTHLQSSLTDAKLGLVVQGPEGSQKRIAPVETKRVTVRVAASNSKYYFIVGRIAVAGRYSWNGTDTVLDAINRAGGFDGDPEPMRIRLIRQAGPGDEKAQVLPVDFDAIFRTADTRTNYQLLPGDRLIVQNDNSNSNDGDLKQSERAVKSGAVTLEHRVAEIERKLDRILKAMESKGGDKPQ